MNDLTHKIIGCFYKVHSELSPGLLEPLPLVSELHVPSVLQEGGNDLAFVTQNIKDDNSKNDRVTSEHYNY